MYIYIFIYIYILSDVLFGAVSDAVATAVSRESDRLANWCVTIYYRSILALDFLFLICPCLLLTEF